MKVKLFRVCVKKEFIVKKIYDKRGNYACRCSEIMLDVKQLCTLLQKSQDFFAFGCEKVG